MLKGFKAFIMRGNVLDLAVGVVIGAAFTAVVNSLVSGLINPLIAALVGKPNFDQVGVFTLNHSTFHLGLILTAVINFVLVAAAIYFCVIMPVNKLREYEAKRKPEAKPEAEVTELDVLKSIDERLQAIEKLNGSSK